MASVGDGDGVFAHVLLNAFSIIAGRAATMRYAWDEIDPAKRDRWLADMERLAVEAAQLCDHLVRVPVPSSPVSTPAA